MATLGSKKATCNYTTLWLPINHEGTKTQVYRKTIAKFKFWQDRQDRQDIFQDFLMQKPYFLFIIFSSFLYFL